MAHGHILSFDDVNINFALGNVFKGHHLSLLDVGFETTSGHEEPIENSDEGVRCFNFNFPNDAFVVV